MADFSKHSRSFEINTFIQSLIVSVDKAQSEFFAKNGRYFQGLNLLGGIETDGKVDLTTITVETPIDFKTTWKEFMPEVIKDGFKASVNIQIDVYKSPKGYGWVLTAKCNQDKIEIDRFGNSGSMWMYVFEKGPQGEKTFMSNEWFLCPEGIG